MDMIVQEKSQNYRQYCRFGSWTHTLAELDVNLAFPGGIDLSTFKTVYKDVSEWDICDHSGNMGWYIFENHLIVI